MGKKGSKRKSKTTVASKSSNSESSKPKSSKHKCSKSRSRKRRFESVDTFQFRDRFPETTNNGLYLKKRYLPEEVITMILSHIDAKEILKATLVCKKWCNIIKSTTLWALKYSRRYNKRPKSLPWYVYYCLFTTDFFNRNMLKNSNGEKEYDHWKILLSRGGGFQIENPPVGADPLPPDVPDFNGQTSCFATYNGECSKLQEITLMKNRLTQLILNRFKPHIYLSEWVAARDNCGCTYSLWCRLIGKSHSQNPIVKTTFYRLQLGRLGFSDIHIHLNNEIYITKTEQVIKQWTGSSWSKIELVAKDYPPGVRSIVFHHQGKDAQGAGTGQYGSKMAGGVVKILFDSMESPRT